MPPQGECESWLDLVTLVDSFLCNYLFEDAYFSVRIFMFIKDLMYFLQYLSTG